MQKVSPLEKQDDVKWVDDEVYALLLVYTDGKSWEKLGDTQKPSKT